MFPVIGCSSLLPLPLQGCAPMVVTAVGYFNVFCDWLFPLSSGMPTHGGNCPICFKFIVTNVRRHMEDLHFPTSTPCTVCGKARANCYFFAIFLANFLMN